MQDRYEHWWWHIIANTVTQNRLADGRLPYTEDGFVYRNIACNTKNGFYSCGVKNLSADPTDINFNVTRTHLKFLPHAEVLGEAFEIMDSAEKTAFMAFVLGSKDEA